MTVAVLGANGVIGPQVGGLLAQKGIRTWFVARTAAKAEEGVARAVAHARSEVIRRSIECVEYASLPDRLRRADWVIECLAEDEGLKRSVYGDLDRWRRRDTVVSTTTSSLSLAALCQGRSAGFRQHFLGTHFFNPPMRMTLCELAALPETLPGVLHATEALLVERLQRVVVRVRDVPGYVANRVAFLVFGHAVREAAVRGVRGVDHLLGSYTGRAMPPLQTLDLIGVDTSLAIFCSLGEHAPRPVGAGFACPDYLAAMVARGMLGGKTPDRGGFYGPRGASDGLTLDPRTLEHVREPAPDSAFVREARLRIRIGDYRSAFAALVEDPSDEARWVVRVLLHYVVHALRCAADGISPGTNGLAGVDEAMAFGFHWAPPSLIADLFGGWRGVARLLRAHGLPSAVRLPVESGVQGLGFWGGKYLVA